MHRKRIVLDNTATLANGVTVKVGVLGREGVRGLGYHDFFAVGRCDFGQHLGQIVERAMPERIVG